MYDSYTLCVRDNYDEHLTSAKPVIDMQLTKLMHWGWCSVPEMSGLLNGASSNFIPYSSKNFGYFDIFLVVLNCFWNVN